MVPATQRVATQHGTARQSTAPHRQARRLRQKATDEIRTPTRAPDSQLRKMQD